MSKKWFSEKELLSDITPCTAHADELATTRKSDWGTYSENADKADDDFLTRRDDVFDITRIEFDGDEQVPSESDYRMALKRIEILFDANPNTLGGDELEKPDTTAQNFRKMIVKYRMVRSAD